jgi:uncharacterized protein (TIGR00297 family)
LLVGGSLGLPVAFVATRVGRITRAGAAAGIACGAIIYAAFYLAGVAVLGVALAVALGASRRPSRAHDVDGPLDDSRRGARNIIANCGIAALAAIAELADLGLRTELAALWCVAAIAAGSSDTVASELGQAYGGRPRSFPRWRPVVPGTPGGVTALGTAAGICAAAVIASPACLLWLLPWTMLVPVIVGATAGAFVESALATAFETKGLITSDVLNAINTGVAALVAVMSAVASGS